MPTVTVIGAQWGDEGKGRVIDLLAATADVVVRSNGGSNAGHSVENDLGRFALALTPSGIFNPAAICILGGGMVVNPAVLLDEMSSLSARGVSLDNLRLSARAALVMPWHQWQDGKRETAAGAGKIGTTKQGIGPAYAEKALRTIMRAIDLRDADGFVAKASAAFAAQPDEFRDGASLPDFLAAARVWAEKLGPLVQETDAFVRGRWRAADDILLEGAQGSLLDLDVGTYPFCTSSDCTALGALKGAGLPPQAVSRVVGVMKAYVTRVGAGPFPTVLNDETGKFIRRVGHEFGTRTGRERDCGWFDGPLARYAVDLGLTEITLTKLDVLPASRRSSSPSATCSTASARRSPRTSTSPVSPRSRSITRPFPAGRRTSPASGGGTTCRPTRGRSCDGSRRWLVFRSPPSRPRRAATTSSPLPTIVPSLCGPPASAAHELDPAPLRGFFLCKKAGEKKKRPTRRSAYVGARLNPRSASRGSGRP